MTATSISSEAQTSIGTRQARLQADYAPLYPEIQANEWQPAAILADRVLAGRLLRGASAALHGRALTDEHFEFRGGGDTNRRGEREGFRPRRAR